MTGGFISGKSAISRPPRERDAYIACECAEDEELEREVRPLLACQEEAGSFFERPAVGHYRVVEKIGNGGMGVIYKSEDIRLHRFAASESRTSRAPVTL